MWWWILIWSLVLLAGSIALALVVWRVIKKVIALGRQLGVSADEVSRLLEPMQQTYRPAVSVLSDPSTLPKSTTGRSEAVGGRRRV